MGAKETCRISCVVTKLYMYIEHHLKRIEFSKNSRVYMSSLVSESKCQCGWNSVQDDSRCMQGMSSDHKSFRSCVTKLLLSRKFHVVCEACVSLSLEVNLAEKAL